MRRRRFLAVFLPTALAGGCLGDRRDESGPRNPPDTAWGGGTAAEERSLLIKDYRFRETDRGTLEVVVDVENTASSRRSDTLVAVAETPDEREEVREDVSVAAESTASVALSFSISHDEFMSDGEFSLQWLSET